MKQYISVILLIAFFTLNSCENILDCIINVRPELHDVELDEGFIDHYYFDKITAEIKNEPNDNSYDYYFDVSGNIPNGIDIIYDYREVILEGTPTESGRFTFRVFLDVDSYNEYYYDEFGNEVFDDSLCTDSTSKTYTLIIN
jgi:hypothetical protein